MSKTEYNYNNSNNLVFHSFNQRKNKKYYYCCSVFAPIININMNCKITHNIDFTRDDIDKIIDRMVLAWKLILEKNEDWFAWGKWLDWVNYVLSYVKEQVAKWRKNLNWKKWNIPNLKTFYHWDEDELSNWTQRWYMFIFWMWVNSSFVTDMVDWKLENFDDYKNYEWDSLKHFTNWWVFLRWWPDSEKYWQEFICDSYAYNKRWTEWLYWNFDIKEAIEHILYRSKYIFF